MKRNVLLASVLAAGVSIMSAAVAARITGTPGATTNRRSCNQADASVRDAGAAYLFVR